MVKFLETPADNGTGADSRPALGKTLLMRALPLNAQVYLALIYLAGLIAVAGACVVPMPHSSAQPWELGLFLALALRAGGKKIDLGYHKRADDSPCRSASPSPSPPCCASARRRACWSARSSSLSGCLYPAPAAAPAAVQRLPVGGRGLAGRLVFLKLNGGRLDLRPLSTFMPWSCPA